MGTTMTVALFIRDFFIWMYFEAPAAYARIWGNILWFLYHFFSIKQLSFTLFARWKQLGEVPSKRGIEEWASVFVVNLLMRVVGASIRLITILVGVASLAIALVLGGVGFILWFLLPFVIISAFGVGVTLLLI